MTDKEQKILNNITIEDVKKLIEELHGDKIFDNMVKVKRIPYDMVVLTNSGFFAVVSEKDWNEALIKASEKKITNEKDK